LKILLENAEMATGSTKGAKTDFVVSVPFVAKRSLGGDRMVATVARPDGATLEFQLFCAGALVGILPVATGR